MWDPAGMTIVYVPGTSGTHDGTALGKKVHQADRTIRVHLLIRVPMSPVGLKCQGDLLE